MVVTNTLPLSKKLKKLLKIEKSRTEILKITIHQKNYCQYKIGRQHSKNFKNITITKTCNQFRLIVLKNYNTTENQKGTYQKNKYYCNRIFLQTLIIKKNSQKNVRCVFDKLQ
eukprot:TRINITY_DN32327_c2_g1_i2.p5 TRINITY_DN32327_c2_g1~~TRINITY_DN32327_c2_g1_i2.p5  ORF type:complete len:113 (-),score=5.26 TRINITY_DN32327_c2_g1_i2:771-1109(-)